MPLILPKPGTFVLEEKRSKFIGCCASVKSEEEAKDFVENIRKQNKDANHNVFAYSVCGAVRFSDDGEPGGTAGMPVLNVFQKAGVIDFVCVVTRYFGGVLLGAGGLVRAYTKTAKGAMDNAEPEELVVTRLYKVVCDYGQVDKMKHRFDKWDIEIVDITYTDCCEATVLVKLMEVESFELNAASFCRKIEAV